MPKIQIVEWLLPVELLNPAADSAGRTSGYLVLTGVQRCTIVCHITQGASSTILLTPLQAQTEEGTNSKVLTNNVPIWYNTNVTVADSFVRATDAKNYTTDAGTKHKIVVFQIDPEYLDTANAFNAIGISTGASSASNITQAMAILEMRDAMPTQYVTISDLT